MMETWLHWINRALYDKYRLWYSKKEIKICLILNVFIYHMIENAEKYGLELSRIIKKEIIPALVRANAIQSIEEDMIVPIEEQLNLNNYISNVYRNLRMVRDLDFMEDALQMTLDYMKSEQISAEELLEFLNSDLENGEIKEGKTLNELIKQIVFTEKGMRVLDNFAGIGETISEVVPDKETYLQLQDSDEVACAMATILLIMKGYKDFRVLNVDTLKYREKEEFDLIVSIPPLIMDTAECYGMGEMMLRMKRDNWAGIAVSLEKLREGGKFITIVNTGALTSGKNSDKYAREYLCKKGYLQTIIELPEKMLYGTNVKVALLIIQKIKNRNIMLIDLDSRSQKRVTRESNKKTQEVIGEVYGLILNHKNSDISRVITQDELRENKELLPSLYIGEETEYQHKDFAVLEEKREELQQNYFELERNYARMLEKLKKEGTNG